MPALCDEVLRLLWQTTIQATVVLLLVLLLRGMFGKVIGNRWKHALWMLVLLRLALPVLPQNRFSVYSLGDLLMQADRPHRMIVPGAISAAPAIFTVMYDPPLAAAHVIAPRRSSDSGPSISRTPMVATAIWLLVALLLIGYRIGVNLRFTRRLKTSPALCHPRLAEALESARRKLRLRILPELVITRELESPAVTGVLRPRILLPIGLADSLSDAQLRLVLLHELSHIKCGDVAVDWLWAIIQSFHWFNPVFWLVSPLRRNDREMARDEMVLRLAGPQLAECYGRTLIALAQPVRLLMFCPGLVGMADGRRGLQRRIKMIARFDGRAGRLNWLGLGLMIAAGCGALTRPKEAVPPAASTANAAATPTTRVADAQVVTWRYDLTDLLFIPPDYLNVPDRDMRVDDLRKYIIDNVDPDSWKENGGAVGKIATSPDRAVFLITQTAAAHSRIKAVLDDLRGSVKQIRVESRFIHLDDSIVKTLPESLRGRLSAVRNAGRYRRDEFLTSEQVTQLLQAVQRDVETTSLTAPRLILFDGQHAQMVVKTQQAYVADLTEVHAPKVWLFDPVVKTVDSEGLVLNIVACTSPDNTSVFVDIDDSIQTLLGLPAERDSRSRDGVVGTIQRPILAMFKINAACGIPDKGTLLLGGSENVDSGDPTFNAGSPDRPRTDAEVKRLGDQESHRHWYVLIKPTILIQRQKQAGKSH